MFKNIISHSEWIALFEEKIAENPERDQPHVMFDIIIRCLEKDDSTTVQELVGKNLPVD